MKMTLSRKDFQEVQSFERSATSEIQDAIAEALEEIESRAQDVWVGRIAQFGHRWHPVDEELTLLQLPVERVIISASDDGSTVYVEFEFVAGDPHTGRLVRLTRVPSTVTFVG
jgi:hypothetical protein